MTTTWDPSRSRPDFLKPRTRGAALVLASALVTACASACAFGGADDADASASYPARDIEILAPGSTGGGWDTRARAIAHALTECDITDQNVSVTNTPGAGGTIGLASFVRHEGDPHQLMVMDTVTMLGGIVTNNSPVDLVDLTPVAGLTFSPAAVVVPADSPFDTLEELLEAAAEDPRGVPFVGGSLGGTDNILLARLAQSRGLGPDELNYVPTGGGGEALSILLSGAAAAGSSSVTEVRGQLESGDLRALAVTGDERVAGIDAPTLDELGLGDQVVTSIGGVLAPPGLSDTDEEAVVALIRKVAESDCWEQSLEENSWLPLDVYGEDFGERIAADRQSVNAVLEDLGVTAP